MRLRALLVSSAEASVEAAAWSAVGSRVRAHAGYALIGEAFGDEAIGFASLSRPDLLIVAWSAKSEVLMAGLRAACPEARALLVGGPEGQADVTSLERLDETLDRVAAEMSRKAPERPRPGKLVVVYSPKGGSGRSQLATNLAIALSRGTSRETLLFDGAMELGEQDLFLNLQAPGLSGITAPHRVEGALAVHPTGVKLLASASSDLPMTPETLAQLLGWVRQRDAWIVVDTHPSLRELNEVFLSEADRVFVPMSLDLSHLRALQRELGRLRERGVESSRFEFVSWDERSEVSREDASRTLKRPIDWSLPYDPGRVRAAINQGIPILQSDPRGALSRELSRLVTALSDTRQTMALVPAHAHPLHGLFSWLRRGPAPNGFGV